jgi:hypothetical protein
MTRTLRYGLILLAAAGLAFGIAVTQTPDGETPANEGVCDELQGGTPGLYGLCVAFCEAQDCENPFEECSPGSHRVLDKYNQKKNAGDPDMPCILPTECPCFTQAELEAFPPQASGEYSVCDAANTTIVASFNAPTYFAQVSGDTCRYKADSELRSLNNLTDDEITACSSVIGLAIASTTYCP